MRAVKERDVEGYLRERVKEAGGEAEKFVSPGKRGVPDRLVSWPGGRKDWVETKRPTGVVASHQQRDHRRRRAMGHEVWTIYTKEQVDEYIEFCKKRQAKVSVERQHLPHVLGAAKSRPVP